MSADSAASPTYRRIQKTKREARIVELAQELRSAPYRHLGRGRSGVDCLGLIIHSYEFDEESHPLASEAKSIGGYYDKKSWSFEEGNEAHLKSVEILSRFLTKHFVPIRTKDARKGDLILMRWKSKNHGDHVAIISDQGRVIHADMKRGVIEHVPDERFIKRILSVHRLK